MHHIFGPGDFLVGEGAEHRGSMHHAPLQHPYYTTIPADKFTPKDSRLINVHVISTLGEAQLHGAESQPTHDCRGLLAMPAVCCGASRHPAASQNSFWEWMLAGLLVLDVGLCFR